MEKIRKISKEQVVMAFVATCIETTARQLNTNYNEIYQRMERVGMIEKIPIEIALEELSKHQPNNQMCILNQDIINKHLRYDRTEKL